jgi:ABC-type multidrug transport system permease subunit
MLRSILAIIAGSVAWMVTALGMDAVMMAIVPHLYDANGKVESLPLLLFSMTYSLLFSVLGGYVTALVAKRKELQHALALGVLQFVMGIAATIKFFDTAPLWYHVVFLTLLIPAILVGGQLRMMQKRRRFGHASPATA